MRSHIAILLAALLWVGLTSGPVFDSEASAQVRPRYPTPPTVANAGEQRERMLKAMSKLQASVDAMRSQMDRGSLPVRVVNAEDIRSGG